MKITYSPGHDVMYIALTDKPFASIQVINPSFALDLDAEGQVTWIELLNVRRIGIEPLTLIFEQITETYGGAALSAEEQTRRRELIAAHRQRLQAKV